jgi:glycosyltransferase involved in cell wall biosynthesis
MDRAVSVIVPTFNRAHFLSQCLDALFSQTVPPTEIVVVNDGSTDGTPEAVAPYTDRIVYLEKPNGGKASALNLGLSHAKGEFIWIFDDDDLSLPDALETHLKAFNDNPVIDFTFSGYHLGIPDSETGSLRIAETFKPFQGPAKSLFLSFAMGASGPQIGFMLQQGMLVRKKCYDAVGPFDESLSRSEDLDMNLRLCRAFTGGRIEQPTFVLRRHEGTRGPSFDLHSYAERERKLFETDRVVLRKLYDTISLSRYLDKSDVATSLEKRQGEALVTRARIMATWHLDDLVTRDFAELKSLVGTGKIVLDEVILHGILFIEALYERTGRRAGARTVRQAMKDILRMTGRGAEHWKYVARYYYWGGLDSYRKGKRREMLHGIAGALEILLSGYTNGFMGTGKV